MKKLAVLDFDGTIYKGDSMLDFARFLDPSQYRRSMLFLSFRYLGLLFGTTSRNDLKASFLELNFNGRTREELEQKGREFFEKYGENCFSSALRWIESAREDHDLIVISGSCTEWLSPFSSNFGSELVSTELVYDKNNVCTGLWKGENMTGKAKVDALRKHIDATGPYSYIIGFGDQKSDILLEELCDEFHLNYFKK